MVNAILIAGGKPVFVEMDPDTHAMDFEELERRVTDQSRVVLLTYLSGLIPDVDKFKKYCEDKNLLLVEDFSQLIGGTYQGRALGSIGDFAVASFSIGKTVTSQVGGCLIINNPEKQERIESLIKENTVEIPAKKFFFHQLLENIKVEILTSKLIFDLFTGPLLKLYAKFFPKRYLSIYKEGVLNRFDKEDLFFDDIPSRRTAFENELFFNFNSFMSQLLLDSLMDWKRRSNLRESNKKLFVSLLSDKVKSKIPQAFFKQDSFAIRCPIFPDDKKKTQLFLIKNGVDTTGYGLNLCNEEKVFDQEAVDLKMARKIHQRSIFIPLHEKISEAEIRKMALLLNTYL
jgi:dTDP-4-amino-4,6-dideoxygalactose transaminase